MGRVQIDAHELAIRRQQVRDAYDDLFHGSGALTNHPDELDRYREIHELAREQERDDRQGSHQEPQKKGARPAGDKKEVTDVDRVIHQGETRPRTLTREENELAKRNREAYQEDRRQFERWAWLTTKLVDTSDRFGPIENGAQLPRRTHRNNTTDESRWWTPAKKARTPHELALEDGMKPFLDQLTEPQRQAVWLILARGKSFREASAIMGGSPALAQRHLTAAKTKLRKLLSKQFL